MLTQEQLQPGFRLGEWEILPQRRMLRRGAEEIVPEPKVWGVLMSLATRNGSVVSRDELIDEVWAGRPTADEPINRCISQLRKHLGDSRPYRYIVPMTGAGYVLKEAVILLDNDGDVVSTTTPLTSITPVARPDLTRWIIAILALSAISIAWWTLRQPPAPSSIVVLPFENASGNPSDQYLTSGFRDEFASTLKQIDKFQVKTSRQTHTALTSQQIGASFDVDTVLRGNVQRIGDELKVTYEVALSRNGEIVAANGITDKVEHVFDIQERLARLLRADLFEESTHILLSASRPSNFKAYDAYLRGNYLFDRRTARNLNDAIALFQKTIELDPSFGPGYLQLATATALMPAYLGREVGESNRLAIEIVEKGIDVDSSIEAAAGAVFGFVYHSQKEWAKSEESYRRATNADVVDANAFNWYSRMLASVGRLDQSLEQALKAWQIEPDNSVINSRVAMTYFWVGESESAQEFFDRANQYGAEGTTHQLGYALFLASVDKIALAREIAASAASGGGLSQESIDAVLSGIEDVALAKSALETVDRAVQAGQLTSQVEFVARTMLDDLDGAMRVARQLKLPGEAFEMDLLWIPQFQALRERPDFLELMQELGVVEYWEMNDCHFTAVNISCSTR